ncbi:MAG: type II 3-dehydroquinate dehydratase [Clostridia bacterium]|nr:type II 3-dehydroquinate dehydratase [Clostridia bacterium]
MKILVINGPNINLLGMREPEIYGRRTYSELLRVVAEAGEKFGAETEEFQSNHEGAIVDRIQAAYGKVDGIVINPAAYTHTSVAIRDALVAVGIPAVEVHISKVDDREAFRHVSFVCDVCLTTVSGRGIAGYADAIEYLCEKITKK